MNLRQLTTMLAAAIALQGASLSSAADYYPFNARFGAPLADLIEYPECPIESRECRRWGVSAAVPVAHRPETSIDLDYLERLYRGGINYIRFNDLDRSRNRIFESWIEGRYQEADQRLWLLDALIPQLRARNMQYALSANDAAYKAEYAGAPENKHPREYKFSQLTHEPAARLASEWMWWIYSRPTIGGEIYGHDPANRYVALVGEDSVYYGMFSHWGEQLDPGTREQLLQCYTEEVGYPPADLPARHTVQSNPAYGAALASCLERAEQNYYATLLTPKLRGVLPAQIATSNSWSGLGYLRHSAELGNVIDMNFYFDHILSSAVQSSGNVNEMVRNRSFISQPGLGSAGRDNILRSNLLTLFASGFDGVPLHISEWNHPFWSDYAYEGPLLLLAYASLQDVPLISLHNLFAWNDDKMVYSSLRGFSAHGNQIFQALNPTLALAYRRGDVRASDAEGSFRLRGQSKTMNEEMFHSMRDPSNLTTDVAQGLERRFRFAKDVGGQQLAPVGPDGPVNFPVRSDTGEIHWVVEDEKNATFTIETPRFLAVAGSLRYRQPKHRMQVAANHHGVVTAVALDGLDIVESEKILLTVVSSQRQSEQVERTVEDGRFPYPLKLVESAGLGGVVLRRVNAEVSLHGMRHSAYRISAIDENGEKYPAGSIEAVDGRVLFRVGGRDTPWYLLQPVARPDAPSQLRFTQ